MIARTAPDVIHRSAPAFVAAVVVCEVVTVASSPLAGAICDAILVLLLLNVHIFTRESSAPPALLPALALVPLAGLIGFAIPTAGIALVSRDGLVAALLLLALWLMSQVVPLRPPALTMTWRDLPRQLLVALCGIPLGLAGQQILHPTPLAQSGDAARMVLTALALGCLIAPTLEMVFRWALQDQLLALHPGAGIALTNVMFASLYLRSHSAGYVLLMGVTGVGLSLAVRRTGILTGAIVAHGLLAIGLLVVWPAVLG